ncbi:hypothetical protein EC991_008434 [Linnemannia zychae]|nr:hypothetical protein EC991_008434 [Linnemannia zychae]
MAHQTPPGILNYDACCSSFRLKRNINAFGAIVGVVIVLNIIALFISLYSEDEVWGTDMSTPLTITAHAFTFLLWLNFVIGAVRTITPFPAQLMLAYFDSLLGLLLLIWTAFDVSWSLANNHRGGHFTFRVGYAF